MAEILNPREFPKSLLERGLKFLILIFEGPPFSGKTTMRNYFLNDFDNIVVLDRFTGSRYVLLRSRGCPPEYLEELFFLEYVIDSHFPVVLFYVTASPHVLWERSKGVEISDQVDEMIASRDFDTMKTLCDLYDEYFDKAKFKYKFRISTDRRTSLESYREAYDLLLYNAPGYVMRRNAWKYPKEELP